jgi:hypothetical protein
MRILDYGRSFIGSKWAYNSVRFWVESRTRILDERTGQSEDFIQCASCKSEDTFAKKNLFYPDNYDFLPIFGTHHTLVFRRRAWFNDNYRTVYPPDQPWGGALDWTVPAASARLLKTPRDIARATHRNLPLVAQTEIWNKKTGLRAIVEHPVKTMNINVEKGWYQTDTGPVAWPDLSGRPRRLVDCLSLAYVAFNAPHFADFVIEAPTPIRVGNKVVCKVRHFSLRKSLPAINRLYAIGTPR